MEDVLREEFHLNADVRGRVVGNVVIEDRGDTVNWSKLGSGGWSIPSNVEDIKTYLTEEQEKIEVRLSSLTNREKKLMASVKELQEKLMGKK